jgi:hypothetical protein
MVYAGWYHTTSSKHYLGLPVISLVHTESLISNIVCMRVEGSVHWMAWALIPANSFFEDSSMDVLGINPCKFFL